MVDLRVSQAVVDGVAQALTTAAGPLQANSGITSGGDGVLGSTAVAGALRGSAEIQALRADTAGTALTTLGTNASGSVAQLLSTDADLARMAG